MIKVIAIDGPGGAGKSTVSRRLAEQLHVDHLDTGAMYRGIAFAALRRGIDPSDDDAVAKLVPDVELDVTPDRVCVDGVDATADIRGPAVTRAVSAVAANQAVRQDLRRRQRAWAEAHQGGVIEGRDIGTVVFPDALLKVFLTAEPSVRAARRANEVSADDPEVVAADLARRDALDSGRALNPLTQADDALAIDTSHKTIDEVVTEVTAEVEQRRS